MVERGETAAGYGRCRCRPRPGIEERKLAEHLSRTQHGEEVLAAVVRGARDLHLAVEDDEQPVAGVTFAEDDVAAVDVAGGHGGGQCRRRVLIERGEQRNLGEDAVHVTSTSSRGVSRRSASCRESACRESVAQTTAAPVAVECVRESLADKGLDLVRAGGVEELDELVTDRFVA